MRGRVAALTLLSLGLIVALPASPVRADLTIFQTATQTQTIESTQTNWGPGTASLLGKDPFTIQKFDPTKIALPPGVKPGQVTLYEVVLSLKYEFQNTIQMDFIARSTTTVTSQGIMHLMIDGVHVSPSVTDSVNSPTFFTQKTLSYPDQLTVPHYLDPVKTVAGTSAIGYFDSSTLAVFTGPGVITAPVVATASSSFMNSSGNGVGGSSTFASAALSVTYYYFIAPEPSSFVLMGLGAVGLCVVARGRHRRKGLEAA